MDDKRVEGLKNYLISSKSVGWGLRLGITVLVLGSAAIAVFSYIDAIANDNGVMILPAVLSTVLTLVFGTLLYKSLIAPHFVAKKQIKAWNDGGELENILKDFATAARPFGIYDPVRLGNTWIFGRSCNQPVKYTDIRALQIQTIKNNGVALETRLVATLNTHQSLSICREFRQASFGTAIATTINAIKLKNPQVKMLEK